MIVHVQDTGYGIKKEDLSRLFKRFSRLDDPKKLNKEGIGLGLSICKAIIRANDGRIEIKSDGLNKGTTVIFTMMMETIPTDELSDSCI
mgnify:CR=1 FL=1